MIIRRPDDTPSSEITPYQTWLNRRQFLGMLPAAAALAAAPGALAACESDDAGAADARRTTARRSGMQEELTPYEDVTTYNNFYEFGTGKEDPSRNAHTLVTSPWAVRVDGLCDNPGEHQLEDYLKPFRMEDRVYRLRCVEGWSMVIPWRGFPLRDLILAAEPRPSANYVEFTTLYDPEQMPGQRRAILDWPYVEGLRMDEALHPLTIMATGLYGRDLPNQNGAPLRLVVPWKYGFKSIKSIVRVRFTERQPVTTWAKMAPDEYGFYANVNPDVDHPRWSQARERRIGEWRRRPTLLFNGYGEQVAPLYDGMDLRRHF